MRFQLFSTIEHVTGSSPVAVLRCPLVMVTMISLEMERLLLRATRVSLATPEMYMLGVKVPEMIQ